MKKVFSINIPGKHGYSFAVECDSSYDEESVIDLALENDLFEEGYDADYANAEDITDSEYDIAAFEGCTYKL
jgi:hypothetical protein